MAEIEGYGISPLYCTCPEQSWPDGSTPSPNWQECRDRAPLGIDPHPVLTADDFRAIAEGLGRG